MQTSGTGGGRILIAIIYHSAYGHTRRQAEAVGCGVGDVDGAEALLVPVENVEQNWDRLMGTEALIFGTPTYMGAASAAFKTFQEATSRAVMSKGYRWKDKLAAGFTNSGAHAGDKLSTLIQLALFAAQHGMHWVNLDLPPGNNSASGSDADPNRLGFWLGAGAQSNTDEGADTAPPESDLATARHLGQRVAKTALQFARGRDAAAAAVRAAS